MSPAALIRDSPRGRLAVVRDLRDLVERIAEVSSRSAVPRVDDDDALDVQAARRGDHDAFARLVTRHTPTVTRLMQRFTREPGMLEELVQDTFVEVHGSLARFRGDAPFVHYLRRIGTRVGYRFWTARRRAVGTVSDEALVELAVDGERGVRDDAEWVHAWLARLSPRDRLVLTLVYLEDCTMVEAAKLAGWSVAMTKVQAHRARKRLARLMENEG